MDHNIKDFTFYHTRGALLEERLEHIRNTMTGDNIPVRYLLGDKGGAVSSERAAAIARRMADAVDDLQKAYWLTSDYYKHDDETEGLIAQNAEWQELLGLKRDYDEEVLFDLSEAPTTLSDTRRKTIEDLFYCALMMATCDAETYTTVGGLRRVVDATARLTPGWSFDGQTDRKPFTQDDLILRELEHNTDFGVGALERNYIDLFALMDALFEFVTGESATALADEGDLTRVRESPVGQEIVNFHKIVADLERGWGSDNLRLLTSLDREAWENLSREERQQLLLDGVDGFSQESLLALQCDDWDISELLDVAGILKSPWGELDAEARREWLRACLTEVLAPFNVSPEEAEALREEAQVWEEEHNEAWEAPERAWHEGVRAWVDGGADTNELFARYASFREGFFEEGLPEGADPGFSELAGRWFASGFAELANTALDIVLGEEGLSLTFDDMVFHRTYAYLGETNFQMERAIMNRGE